MALPSVKEAGMNRPQPSPKKPARRSLPKTDGP